mgnify:CR=1 FL=1
MPESRIDIADSLISTIWKTAKGFRDSGAAVNPVAQVWSLKNRGVNFVNPPQNIEDPHARKSLWAEGIREVKKSQGADMVLMIIEAWAPPVGFGLEALNLHMHGIPIQDLPGRRELLMLAAETAWGTQRTLVCEIKDNQLSQEEKDTGWEPLTATGRLSGWFSEEL